LSDLFVNDDNDKIAAAQSADEVAKIRDEAIAKITNAEATAGLPAAAIVGMDEAIKETQRKADRRIEHLRHAEEAKSKGLPAETRENKDNFSINGTPWDAKTNPVRIAWLPGFANDRLNAAIGR